jgi:hypothetical protein
MRELEARDARERLDGTPQVARLRQIPSVTGRFLALAASTTSSSWSTSWARSRATRGSTRWWCRSARGCCSRAAMHECPYGEVH